MGSILKCFPSFATPKNLPFPLVMEYVVTVCGEDCCVQVIPLSLMRTTPPSPRVAKG
jgi:hypothetical protein